MKIFKQALKFRDDLHFLENEKKLLDEFLKFDDLNLYLDSLSRKRFFIKLAKKPLLAYSSLGFHKLFSKSK